MRGVRVSEPWVTALPQPSRRGSRFPWLKTGRHSFTCRISDWDPTYHDTGKPAGNCLPVPGNRTPHPSCRATVRFLAHWMFVRTAATGVALLSQQFTRTLQHWGSGQHTCGFDLNV